MSRSRRLAAALVTALALAAGAAAEESTGWAYDLAHELMSPYCPGRALAECPSPQADALRLWILEQSRAGATREEVEAQLLQSFGDRLLQTPRAEGVGLVAYVVPVLLVAAGAAFLALFLRRQSTREVAAGDPGAPGAAPRSVAPAAGVSDPELERRLDRELGP